MAQESGVSHCSIISAVASHHLPVDMTTAARGHGGTVLTLLSVAKKRGLGEVRENSDF